MQRDRRGPSAAHLQKWALNGSWPCRAPGKYRTLPMVWYGAAPEPIQSSRRSRQVEVLTAELAEKSEALPHSVKYPGNLPQPP